jgi:hypothetical protein
MLIRLIPNRSFPFRRLRSAARSVVERGVGRRLHRSSDAEQALERVELEEPPVEADSPLGNNRISME